MAVYTSQNNKQSKTQSIKTKIGIALICVSIFFLINLMFNLIKFLNSFLLGTFGLFSYAIFIGLIVYGIMLIRNRKISVEPVDALLLIAWLISLLLIIQVATSSQFFDCSYGNYIAQCYKYKLTCGGALISILTYPFKIMFNHLVAIYIILAIILLAITSLIIVRFVKYKDDFINALYGEKQNKKVKLDNNTIIETPNTKVETTPVLNLNEKVDYEPDDLIIPDEQISQINTNAEQVVLNNDYRKNNDHEKEKAKNILGLSSEKSEEYDNSIIKDFDKKMSNYDTYTDNNYKKPKRFVHNETTADVKPERKLSEKDKENLKYLHEITGYSSTKSFEEKPTNVKQNQPNNFAEQYDVMDDLYDANLTKNNYKQAYNQTNNFQFNKPKLEVLNSNEYLAPNASTEEKIDNFDNGITTFKNNINSVQINNNPTTNLNYTNSNEHKKPEYKQEVLRPFETRPEPNKKVYKKPSKYIRPDVSLLNTYNNVSTSVSDDYTEKARMLEETLESFNAPAKVVTITKGPAFTRFELQMQQGIPVKRVNALVDDIAMTLKARGDIRMEIPVPGKNAFGVEIPNEQIETVGLREIIESYNFQGNKSALAFALGKDITGEAKVARIDKMPHLLVAGSTGSGKSVCLNSMLVSLLFKASPEDLKLILIDPKRVEFTLYNGLPHMLLPKAITDVDKAVKALDWLIKEMDRRYNRFAESMVRNIEEYNERPEIKTQTEPKMPFIVFIVDELGDLMLQRKKEVEEKIIRLTQLSRAAGIYLVIATQRPSVDVITGTIKANLPSRIAFAVSSFPDSKTILDQGGAEKLLGKGDMLYSPNGSIDLLRIQGAFVSGEEVARVVEFVKENNECEFDSDIEDEMFNTDKNSFSSDGGNTQEFDPLLKDALRLFIKQQNASISKLQRFFGIGFPRAAKIVDQMEAAGFVGPKDNKNLRPLYITQQEFEERFGEDL